MQLDDKFFFFVYSVPGAVNDVQQPDNGPTLALPSLPPAQLSKENPVENLQTAQISTGKRL